jgi:hypothetical protein
LANLERQVELLLLMTCSVTHLARLAPQKICTAIGGAWVSGRLTRQVRVRWRVGFVSPVNIMYTV